MKKFKNNKSFWKRYSESKTNKNYRAGRNGTSRFENSES